MKKFLNIDDLDLEEIDRDAAASFINVTPKDSTKSWKLLGIGITEYGIAYNPEMKTVKWIIEKNNRNSKKSMNKQGAVAQTMHKGDPCFEYVNTLKDKTLTEVETEILDIDFWNTSSESATSYPATLSKCSIVVTNYLKEEAEIEYTIYYNGDPVEGTVTMTDGVPTFVPNAD